MREKIVKTALSAPTANTVGPYPTILFKLVGLNNILFGTETYIYLDPNEMSVR